MFIASPAITHSPGWSGLSPYLAADTMVAAIASPSTELFTARSPGNYLAMASDYEPPVTPQPAYEPKPPAGAPYGAASSGAAFAPPWQTQQEPPRKRSGWGCVGCLLGCAGVMLVGLVLAGIGVWWGVKQIPNLARTAIEGAVRESDLTEEDKKVVMQQVDRFIEGYKQGKVSTERVGRFFEEFAESPLMDLMIAYAARVKYVDPSGLSEEEKRQAERTLQRTARGVIEKRISRDDLSSALDHISTSRENGARELHDSVTDDQLRAFLDECKRLADEAEVPDEEYQADIGGELKKLVDQALGEAPVEAPVEAPLSEEPLPGATQAEEPTSELPRQRIP